MINSIPSTLLALISRAEFGIVLSKKILHFFAMLILVFFCSALLALLHHAEVVRVLVQDNPALHHHADFVMVLVQENPAHHCHAEFGTVLVQEKPEPFFVVLSVSRC